MQANRLQLFGLRWAGVTPLDYVTLDEALQSGQFEVTEISAGGSVPTLRVRNDLDRRVFLLAGEQLVGAKQNRVLNVSILAEAHSGLPVPVSCVERGRWRYRSPRFSGSGRASHGYLRRGVCRSALESYRRSGRHASNQQAVWREVDRKLEKLGSPSPSAALDQAYEDYESRLAETLAKARLPDDCQGVVYAFGGRVCGLDLFDQPATLQKLLPKLIRAYALDALEEDNDGELDRAAVEAWLQDAPAARFEQYASPGLGEDVRVESEKVVGAVLIVEERPVHMELFPGDDAGTGGGERPAALANSGLTTMPPTTQPESVTKPGVLRRLATALWRLCR